MLCPYQETIQIHISYLTGILRLAGASRMAGKYLFVAVVARKHATKEHHDGVCYG